VPVERLRGHETAVLVDILCGRRSPDPLPQLTQAPQQLFLGGEPARDESGSAFGAVPAAEALDHGLRMDRRRLVFGELAHRRRAPEPAGALLQLAKDVLVRVALADSGLELRERLRVDARDRAVRALAGHGNQDRAR